jgi:Tfp pilus assembly protein PilV
MAFSIRGFSLLQVTISVGVLSILALAMLTMSINQAAALRYLEQKAEALEIKTLIGATFQEPNVCSCQVNPSATVDNFNDANLWFDSAVVDGSQSISVKKLKSGCELASPGLISEGQRLPSGLVVDKINLVNLLPTSNPNQWQGDWQVTWVTNPSDRPQKPVLVKGQKFLIDIISAGSTLNHRLISVCEGMGTQLRIEAGTGVIPDTCFPGPKTVIAGQGWFCTAGAPHKDITFSVPFTVPPKVIVTLSGPSANSGLVPCSLGAMDQVGTSASNITTTGFRGRSWFSPESVGPCDPGVRDGTAPNMFDWIAIGR